MFPTTLFRRCVLLLWLLAVAGSVHADRLDDYVRTQMLWLRIPGLSLAILKDGRVVKVRGYGLANVETNTPATSRTVYKIGSLSKQFLAAGVLILVQEGKVSLDAPISAYLDSAPETWRSVTVRRLLTHTSGMVREAPGFDPYKAQSNADVIASAYPVPLRFAPGEKWEYSNTGYYCLAEIVSKVSGKPWSEFLQERLFAPAGMTRTRTTTSDIVPDRAAGYETRGALRNAENWIAVRPSGAFLSTVEDFARWDAALSSDTILSDATREQMWTPVSLTGGGTYPYGFGWFVNSVRGHRRVAHSGGVPGFVCEFQRYPDDRLSVVVMANVGGRDLGDIAQTLAGFYLPALRAPETEPALSDQQPAVTARVREILVHFTGGRVDPDRFTPEMAKALAADRDSGFTDILRRLGPIRALELIEYRPSGAERLYRYRLTYRNLRLFVACTFGKEDRIVRFSIQD